MSSDPPVGTPPPSPSEPPDTFFARVYEELRSIAHARLRGEHGHPSLQTTELVHEAYLRLRGRDGNAWPGRGQFFAAAALAMRRILIERARARSRVKRGGDADGRAAARVPLDLEEVVALADDRDPEAILAMDEAIDRLAGKDDRAAQVVRLRFYGGLDVEETAEALGTSTRTVLRDWAFARAWLHMELTGGESASA